ncbi:MAG: iron ABC transporter permease [Deltaproteobacteria bacterium]|nr:iron ABC transporter permease [Deltaproteobacteria bacterium]
MSNTTTVTGFSLRKPRDNKLLILFRKSAGFWIILPVFLILIFLIVYPYFILIYGSFTNEPPRQLSLSFKDLTLDKYRNFLSNPLFWSALKNTLIASCGGTALALTIGVWLAWLTGRTNVIGKKIIGIAAIVPLFLPSFIGALAWSFLGNPQVGIINIFLRGLGLPFTVNIYSMGGIIFIFGLYYTPYVYMFTSASLDRMDPTLEEASAISGASNWQTSFKVTFPLILPAITSAAILVCILMCELFAVPAILGQPAKLYFVPTVIYNTVMGAPPHDLNLASAMGILLIVVVAVLLFIQNKILRKRSFITVAGKGVRPKEVDLHWARIPCFVSALFYLLVAVVLPYMVLIQSALREYVYMPDIAAFFSTETFSLSNVQAVLSDSLFWTAMWNTISMAVFCGIVGGMFYLIISYMIHKTKLPGRHLLNYICMLPIAVAGLVKGMAYLWAWISLPIGIYGTVWILILAYISRFTPQGLKAISSSMVQIHPELEEASRISGGGVVVTIRRILFPLVRPGVFSAVTLIMLLCVRELSTSIFLYTSESVVMTVLVYDLWDSGAWGEVAVTALCLSFTLLGLVILSRVLLKSEMVGQK